MSKKPIYFSHDVNAIINTKIGMMLQDYGAAGYALYWRIVEMLHVEESHQLQMQPHIYTQISRQLYLTPDYGYEESFVKEFVRRCIEMYGLFEQNGTFLWSDRVHRNIEQQSKISARRAEAGSKGGKARVANQATKSGGTPLPSQITTAPSDVTSDSNFIPIQANATNGQANATQANATNSEAIASIAQANALNGQANIFVFKNRIEDSSLLSSKSKESKGVWGKNGKGVSDFSNFERGNDESNGSSAATNGAGGSTSGNGRDYFGKLRRSRQELPTSGERNGDSGVPLFSHSRGTPRS